MYDLSRWNLKQDMKPHPLISGGGGGGGGGSYPALDFIVTVCAARVYVGGAG